MLSKSRQINRDVTSQEVLIAKPSRRDVLHAGAICAAATFFPSIGRAADFKGTTVTVAVGSFMSSGVTMFKEQWEKATGGRVNIVEIPFGDLYQRLFTAFTSGAAEFDVAIYASNWIPEFALAKQILSLEKYYPLKDNWNSVLPKVQKIMYVGNERYSVPMDGDVIIGYFRTDALGSSAYQEKFAKKFGYPLQPPSTWSEYHDIAEFFTGWDWSGTGTKGWGVLEAQKPKDVGPFIFTSRAANYAANPSLPGSIFFDPDTMEPQIDNPGWVEALNDWIAIRKFGPPEMATYGGGEMRGNFIAGHYALGIDWADVGIMAQDENSSIVKGKLGYFVLPGSKKVWNYKTKGWDSFDKPSQAPYLGWGGWHASVAANSKHPDAAWDFANFLDTTPNAFRAVTTPGTARNPYRTDHFSDPKAWESAPVHYRDPAPYLETLLKAMDHPNSQFDLRIPKAGRYFDVLDQWVQQALAGSMSADAALKQAAKEWARITDEAGKDNQRKLYRGLYGLSA
jgi:multiple sugar transport system substrate-binding protein